MYLDSPRTTLCEPKEHTMISCLMFLALSLAVAWCYCKLRAYRRIHSAIPSLKRSFFFGSLLELEKYMSPDRHGDYGFEKIYEDLGEPECFYIDFRPFHFLPSMLVVTSPYIAEQISRPSSNFPYAYPKSWTMQDLVPLIGSNSIILSAGERWKRSRKQFQPGFQPQHLQTILPLIVREARIFTSRLEKLAETQGVFELRRIAQDLTVDIIGSVTLNQSFGAQTHLDGEGPKGPRGVFTAFKRVQHLFVDRANLNLSILNPIRAIKLAWYQHILNGEMHRYLSDAIGDSSPSVKSVAFLAMKDRPLNRKTMQDAVDQLRSFVFAGFDTTSTVLQWVFYYLSLPHNKQFLDLIFEEHNNILGPVDDINLTEAILSKLPSMPITESIIKECLRLQPPAGAARQASPHYTSNSNDKNNNHNNEPITITLSNGTTHPVTNTVFYINHRILHNATKIWGPTAKIFNPLRWLDKAYMSTIPQGAFRPFERGPRACIGQDLAMMEAKIVLGMAVRRFEFRKPRGSRVTDLGDAWSVYQITAGPNDGMKMRVRRRRGMVGMGLGS